jgi:hypothetical protein
MSDRQKDYEFYLSELETSSNRSRWALYVLLISSLLFFSIHWNTALNSFLESRIDERLLISSYIKTEYHLNESENKKNVLVRPFTPDETKRVEEGLKILAGQKKQVDLNAFELSLATDIDSFDKKTEILLAGNTERKGFFKVPFLDVQFDANELGLFSSIHLLIVTIIFLYCLIREKTNLEMVFNKTAKDRDFENFYDKISMQQVLTSPPGIRGRVFFIIVQKLLYFAPLITQCLIFYTDYGTYETGIYINKVEFLIRYNIEIAGTILIALFTYWAIDASFNLDIVWTKNDPKKKRKSLGGAHAES